MQVKMKKRECCKRETMRESEGEAEGEEEKRGRYGKVEGR